MTNDMANGKTKFWSDLPVPTRRPVGWPENGKDWFWEGSKRGDFYKIIDDTKKVEPPAPPPVAPIAVPFVPPQLPSRPGKLPNMDIYMPNVQDSMDRLRDSVKDITRAFDKLGAKVRDLETRSLTHDAIMQQYKAEQVAVASRVTALENETKTLQQEIDILKTQKSDAEELAKNLAEQNENLQSEVEALEDEISSSKKSSKNKPSGFSTGGIISGTSGVTITSSSLPTLNNQQIAQSIARQLNINTK